MTVVEEIGTWLHEPTEPADSGIRETLMSTHHPDEEIGGLTPEETAVLDGLAQVSGAVGRVGAPFGGRVKDRIGILRRQLAAGLVKKGVARDVALETVGAFGDGHILELLIKYGPDIMKMVMAIMALFGL